MTSLIDRIELFIEKVRSEFPIIMMGYEYLSYQDTYRIWHNREDFEYGNKEFETLTANLLDELFDKIGDYNVFITYDYTKPISLDTDMPKTDKVTSKFEVIMSSINTLYESQRVFMSYGSSNKSKALSYIYDELLDTDTEFVSPVKYWSDLISQTFIKGIVKEDKSELNTSAEKASQKSKIENIYEEAA